MNTYKWPKNEYSEPYTKEQLLQYAEIFLCLTGIVMDLEEGNYYPIDYSALGNYGQKPKDRFHYVLNSVGRVFYLENLTEQGKIVLDFQGDNDSPTIPPIDVTDSYIVSPSEYFALNVNNEIMASDYLKALPYPVDLVIPSTLNGIEIKNISGIGFYNLNNIRKIVIKNGIENISRVNGYANNGAFAQMTKLEEVILPNSMKIISNIAFKGSTSLRKIHLNEAHR